jgi:hypothetical protein
MVGNCYDFVMGELIRSTRGLLLAAVLAACLQTSFWLIWLVLDRCCRNGVGSVIDRALEAAIAVYPFGTFFMLGGMVVLSALWLTRSMPTLVRANLDRWRTRHYYSINEAAFLWSGYQEPATEQDVGYWVEKSKDIRDIKATLLLICEGKHNRLKFDNTQWKKVLTARTEEAKTQGGWDISRADLQRFAADREKTHGTKYPDFLEPRPAPGD